MSYGPYQESGFRHQGQRSPAPRPWEDHYRATNDHENQNDMPYTRVGGVHYQQPPRPLNQRDPRYTQEHPPWQYHTQDSVPPQSPELPPSHSSGSVRTDKFDAEVQREKLREDAVQRVREYYENKISEHRQAQQIETERTQQRHEKQVKELTQDGAELRRKIWILEVEVYGKPQTTANNDHTEIYRRLTEEFTSLGLAAEIPDDSDQQKPPGGRMMPLCQKKLLTLHVSYVQKQMDHHNNIPAEEVEAISKMIKYWEDIDALEWRQAYSLWCTALLKQGDQSVEFCMRHIWPHDQTEGESSDVRLWRFQIGDELCKFLSSSHADHAEAGIILRKRLLKEMEAQKELTDPKSRARLHEDTVQTGLSLAQAYLDQLSRPPSSNSDKQRSLRRESMEKLEEIWNKNKEQRRGLTPTILAVGQKLGCLMYTHFREEKAERAKEVLESVWTARKANLPQNLEDTLLTGHHLFLMYTHLRSYSEAKLVFEEVWKTAQLMPTSKLDKNLKFYHSLTDFLRQSLETEPSYGVTPDLLGKSNDGDELKLCAEIGMIFFRDERYLEAEAILRQAYNAYKTSRPPDSQGDTTALACGQCLAYAVAAQNKYSDAVAIFEEFPIEWEHGAPGAQQADELELHRYGRVLMQHVNHEISSRSLSPKVLPSFLHAVQVCPGAVQEFFKAPEMHNCARRLLLELVKSRQYDAVDSLLGLLKHPEIAAQDILPFIFRYELCRCIMKQENYEMADRLLAELLETSNWGRDEPRDQEVIIELGFWLLDESKIEDALRVFNNAKVTFGNASRRIDEGRRIAIEREKEIPPLILTPEDDTATDYMASRREAAPRPTANTGSKTRPKVKPTATARLSTNRVERGSMDFQRWGANPSGSEVASDRSGSPKRPRSRSDQSPQRRIDQSPPRKNGQNPRRRSEPKPVEKPRVWNLFGRPQGR